MHTTSPNKPTKLKSKYEKNFFYAKEHLQMSKRNTEMVKEYKNAIKNNSHSVTQLKFQYQL